MPNYPQCGHWVPHSSRPSQPLSPLPEQERQESNEQCLYAFPIAMARDEFIGKRRRKKTGRNPCDSRFQARQGMPASEISVRPMVYLSFVFDHRILDGASADHFLMKVKETLEEWS
jgi:hypothetical protein